MLQTASKVSTYLGSVTESTCSETCARCGSLRALSFWLSPKNWPKRAGDESPAADNFSLR